MKVLSFLFLFSLGVVFAQAPGAVITEMSGTVELKRPGSTTWTAARAGDVLERATVISTGFQSMALLTVGNSTITVRPITRLSLEELLSQEDTERVNVNLRTGRIQVDVNPPAGSKTDFTVQSPIAVASVRGTSFTMDPVNIRVKEGMVKVETGPLAGASTMVNSGQSTKIETESGRVVNPWVAAEQSRALPALAGQDATAIEETAALAPAGVSLSLEVTLESQ